MRNRILALGIAVVMFFALAACNNNKREANKLDKDQVRAALDNAGYKDVKFDIDNDKNVVTLTGDVDQPEIKTKAEEVVKNVAANYVIANEIAVRPQGAESEAKKVDSNLDDAIKSDWKALEAQNKWGDQHIRTDVKNGVLTLKGDVDTETQRTEIEKSAAKLPNVQQVVNELQVKNAKNANKKKSTAAQE